MLRFQLFILNCLTTWRSGISNYCLMASLKLAELMKEEGGNCFYGLLLLQQFIPILNSKPEQKRRIWEECANWNPVHKEPESKITLVIHGLRNKNWEEEGLRLFQPMSGTAIKRPYPALILSRGTFFTSFCTITITCYLADRDHRSYTAFEKLLEMSHFSLHSQFCKVVFSVLIFKHCAKHWRKFTNFYWEDPIISWRF